MNSGVLQVTGTLENTDFLKEFQGVEGVLYARPLVEPGASCVCVDDGLPTWYEPALGCILPACLRSVLHWNDRWRAACK
jgi:hypothetical protein